MSTELKYQETVNSIFNTWAKNVIDVEIFIGSNKNLSEDHKFELKLQDSPKYVMINQLGRVTDDYPPQYKSFRMIHHVYQTKIDLYDWFIRIDDDAYVNVHNLHKFLIQFDPQTPLYIGKNGYEKVNQNLGLNRKTYCMGGSGVILSRALLRQIGQKIMSQIKYVKTKHEDTEIGRLIDRIANIQCLNDSRFKHVFIHVYQKPHFNFQEVNIINSFKYASIIHPFKTKQLMYKIHSFIELFNFKSNLSKWNQLNHKFNKTGEINKCISGQGIWQTTKNYLHQKYSNINTFHLRDSTDYYRVEENQLLKTFLIKNSPKNGTISFKYNFKNALICQSLDSVNKQFIIDSKTKKSGIVLSSFNKYGLVEVINKEILETTNKMRILVTKQFKNHEFESYLIRIIQYLSINMTLSIVVFKSKQNEDEQFNRILKKYEILSNPFIFIKIIDNGQVFSRAKGLNEAFKLTHFLEEDDDDEDDDEDVLFLSDLDFIFNERFLQRCQQIPQLKRTVYSPIVFSEYSTFNSSHFNETNYYESFNANGFWRIFGYGAICIKSGDFKSLNGLNEDFIGWGGEDVDFLERIMKLKSTNHEFEHMNIFRAIDDGISHKFHPHNCSISGQNYTKSCLKTSIRHIGSTQSIVDQLISKKYIKLVNHQFIIVK